MPKIIVVVPKGYKELVIDLIKKNKYKTNYFLRDVIKGKVEFKFVRIQISRMEIQIIRKENLVYNNDNIRCVLCGHVGSRTRVLYSTNSQGRIVPQIEFNIQHEPHGGNGLIQLWEFPKDDDNVYIRTFNACQHEYVTDSITEYQFKYR